MHWVDDERRLADATADLGAGDVYFIDTEFESTRQATRLSVIQVSRGHELYLLDALLLEDLRDLGRVLCRPECVWVLHAGLQDMPLLLDAFGQQTPPRLFDTQIAWALQGPEANVSLSYLKFVLLGIRSMKTHQSDDWMRRPLPSAQLAYAADDIVHLPQLHSRLSARIDELGRAAVLDAACREALLPSPLPQPALDLSSFRNAWQLEPRNQAALRYLIDWYNSLDDVDRARAPNCKTLLAIASRLPQSARDLMRIKGVPAALQGRRGERMVSELNRAARSAQQGDFERIDPAPYATFEDQRLEAWLMLLRAEVCNRCNIAPELAFPARDMKRYKAAVLSGGPPELLSSLQHWRREVLLKPTQRFVESFPPPV